LRISMKKLLLSLLILGSSKTHLVFAQPVSVPAASVASAGPAQSNPWTDLRLLNWSHQLNAGQFDKVLQEVQADLITPSPHPFSIDIWCRLQMRRHNLDSAAEAITDPTLKKVLGIVPKLYSLDFDNKYIELESLAKTVSASDIHGALVWHVIIGDADNMTDFSQGFDWALHGLRAEEPNFILVWEVFNLADSDRRVNARLKSLLAQDQVFAASPAGRALQSAVNLRTTTFETRNSQGRSVDMDEQFSAIARRWLESYPNDAGATLFMAIHQILANDDWDKSVALVDQALASYPLLSVGSVRTAVLGAALKKNTDPSNAAAERLSATWAQLEFADQDKAKAYAAARLASSLQANKQGSKASQEIEQVFNTIPAADRAPLLAERAEVEMVAPNDPLAASSAVADATLNKSLRDDFAANALLIRALVNTKSDADAQQALTLYREIFTRFTNHTYEFYKTGDGLLATLGTPQQQENWEAAVREFPNSASTLDWLAKAQIATGRPQDALKTMNVLFQIVDPEPYYVPTMEAVWTNLQDPSTLTSTLANFMNSNPRLFKDATGSHTLPAPYVAVNRMPEQLKLVPQTPLQQRVTLATLSPDGRLAAVADAGGTVELWSIVAPVLSQPGASVTKACTSILDRTCPRILRTIYAHTGRVASLQYSDDDQWLVTTGEDDGTVKVWRVATGQLLWSIKPRAGTHLHAMAGPALKGQTQLLAIFVQESLPPKPGETNSFNTWSTLRLCHLDTGSDSHDINWYSNALLETANNEALAWASDGKLLAARISNSETLLVDPTTMHLVRAPQSIAIPAHASFNSDLSSVVFPDGSTIKYQSLDQGSKPSKVADFAGDPLSVRMMPSGSIRYAVLDPELAKPTAPDDNDAAGDTQTAAKPVSPPQRNIQVFEASAPSGTASAPPLPVRIAAFPAASYPVPSIQLNSLADRFTVFSTAMMITPPRSVPAAESSLASVAIGYVVGANAGAPVMQLLASDSQVVPNSVAFTPEGRYLLVSRSDRTNVDGQTRLDIWDLAVDGRPLKLKNRLALGPTVAFSAGTITTCPSSGSGIDSLRSFDLAGNPISRPVSSRCRKDVPVITLADGSGIVWSSDPLTAAVALSDGSAWNPAPSAPPFNPEPIKAVAATARVLVGITAHDLYLVPREASSVDLCNGNELCPAGTETPQPDQPDPGFSSVAISTDGRFAVAAIGPSEAHSTVQPGPAFGVLVADLQSNSLRVQKDSADTSHMAMTAVAFVPNSTRYAAGTVDGRLLLADATSPGMQVLFAEDSSVAAIAVSADGQFLAAAFDSGAVRLWQLGADAHALARLDTFADDDWSVVSLLPLSGQYDAARDGKLDELLWVYGNQTVQLDQMLSNYYRPRLLPRLLRFDATALAASPPLNTFAPLLPPTVDVQSIDANTGEVVLGVTDGSAAAVGTVKIYSNGARVETTAKQVTPDGKIHVKMADRALLPGESNHLNVVVGNTSDTIESRGTKVVVVTSGTAVATHKQFYAIIAGISSYGHGVDNLPLADADAREMAMDIARGATHLVGDPSFVHIYLLTSDAKLGTQVRDSLQAAHLGTAEWSPPTHDNFMTTFAKVQGLKPRDIFMLFLAGHGQLFGENREYGYPTSEFTTDGEPVAGSYLTSAELTEGLRKTQASNTILLFDTCNAGGLQAALDGEKRDLAIANQSQHDNEGSSFVLMGASANKFAFDSKDLNHGFLTTGLLLSMREDLRQDKLMARAWLDGAQARTSSLATARNYIQDAQDTKTGPDLQIGLFKSQDIACIPDLNSAPVVTEPFMEDESTKANDQEMQKAVADQLEEQTQPAYDKPPFIFREAVSDPDHIGVTGHYVLASGQLTMTLTLSYAQANYKTVTLAPVAATEQISDDVRTQVAQEAVAAIRSYAQSVWAATAPHIPMPPASCMLAGNQLANP
jgi:WD40 repeat protein